MTGFQEAIQRSRKEVTIETESLKEQCEGLERRLSDKDQEVQRLQQELAAAQSQVAQLKKDNRRVSRQVEKSSEYKEIQLRSLERRLSKWDRAFAEATGLSLHEWNGSRKELREALRDRPDSEED